MAANIKTLKINVDSASKMISKLPSIDKISPIKEYNFKKRLDNMNGLLKKNMSMDSFFDSKNLIFKNKEKSKLLTNKLKKFSTIDMSNIKINKSNNILSSTNNKSSEQEKKPKNKTIKINVVQEKGNTVLNKIVESIEKIKKESQKTYKLLKNNERKTNVLKIKKYNNWNRIKSKSENSKLKDERMISPKTMDSLLSPRAYKPNDEEIKSIMPKTTNNITGLLKRDINYQNDESKGNKIIFVKTKIKKLFHKRNLAISKEQLDNNFFKAGIVTNLWRKIGFLREKEMQINDIFNKIKLLLDNIDHFKVNYFNNGNFYAAFENMKNMNKAELNLTIEELCFILIEIVPKLLQKFFDELDRILYIKIPDIEQEMEKIPTSEKECLELNCAFLNTVSLYFTGCTDILKEILKRVDYFKFTDNEFLIIDNYLDLARFDINKINSMAEIYIDKMKNDEKIFEKIEVGLGIRKKKINHMGDILERTHKRYSQNFKDEIKLERINSSLNLKHDLFGLNEKRKKFILMRRTKNLDILNQPIVANLMKYFNDNIKSQIISQQVFERYKLKEREAQNVVVSKSD
jgi:hypothetical protein